jgi:hypothetical protein
LRNITLFSAFRGEAENGSGLIWLFHFSFQQSQQQIFEEVRREIRLIAGTYRPQPNVAGYRWSQQLNLVLGIYDRQLRFFDAQGILVPSPDERVEQERQRAE